MVGTLLPLRAWIGSGVAAALIHVAGALVIDYFTWKVGWAYEVMAGQFLLLAGAVWLVIVLVAFLARLRRLGYLDPVRIILWVVGVSLLSAPLKALGERLMEPLLRAAYAAYPARRAAALRTYLQQQIAAGKLALSPQKIEEIIETQIRLYHAYRARQQVLGYAIIDRAKVLGVLGLIYGLILGLLLRGGGTAGLPGGGPAGGGGGNAG
ncbi:MAG: hypothetical protein ABDH91_00845 [Bacteroidia bacterium]